MKKYYDKEEIELILSKFRKYLSTNQLILTKEERQTILNKIDIKKFTCNQDNWGVVGFGVWSLPILFVKHPNKKLTQTGEGIEGHRINIYRDMKRKIFARCLVDIWDGNVTDEMLIYAALIEVGNGLKVIPKMNKSNSLVHNEALLILKQRKIKHDDQQQT